MACLILRIRCHFQSFMPKFTICTSCHFFFPYKYYGPHNDCFGDCGRQILVEKNIFDRLRNTRLMLRKMFRFYFFKSYFRSHSLSSTFIEPSLFTLQEQSSDKRVNRQQRRNLHHQLPGEDEVVDKFIQKLCYGQGRK